MRRTLILIGIGALLAIGRAEADEYTVTDLSDLGFRLHASDLNDSGEVTGWHEHPQQHYDKAFIYSGGMLQDIPISIPPIGTFDADVRGMALSFDGHVVGTHQTDAFTAEKGFLYQNATLKDLGTPIVPGVDPDLIFIRPIDINATGQVLVEWNTGAFLSHHGLTVHLQSVDGRAVHASGLNDHGQVAGCVFRRDDKEHAVIWTAGAMTDLGLGPQSCAADINDRGEVVGVRRDGAGAHRAFFLDGATFVDLGALVGGTKSAAGAINAGGDVIGSFEDGGLLAHGFLYRSTEGALIVLDDVVPAGVRIHAPIAINNAGQILAYGSIEGQPPGRYLLLTPTVLNRFAYALADQPESREYRPNPLRSYNASGGEIVVRRLKVGTYDVEFDALPAWGNQLSSAVAISSFGGAADTCSSVNSSSSPSKTVVTVTCMNLVSKLPVDSRFAILLVGNSGIEGPSAFLRSGGPVPAVSKYGSWTGLNLEPAAVTHNGTPGSYDVRLGSGPVPGSVKLVTATGAGGNHCVNVEAPAGPLAGDLRVACWDFMGAPSDAGFSTIQIAGGRPGRRLGFATADRPTEPSYTPTSASSSSGGPILVTRSSQGRYTVKFSGLGAPGRGEHVQVTPRAGGWATCGVAGWSSAGDDLEVAVDCRDISAQHADTRFDLLVIE